MTLVERLRSRREMTTWARLRRRIQRLRPYPSLVLLMAPLAVVEPLKLVGCLVAGGGHWLTGTAMVGAAYATSLLIVERLFRTVKPKLLMISWFATFWELITKLRNSICSSRPSLSEARKSGAVMPADPRFTPGKARL
jgi:hypothetical protein